MSANNWTKCPNCEKNYKSRVDGIKALYGKIPEEAYSKKLAEAQQADKKLPNVNTLREDYEVYTQDGIFYCSYCCYCTECKFQWSYKVEKQVYG